MTRFPLFPFSRYAVVVLLVSRALLAAEPDIRTAAALDQRILVPASAQPAEYRYLAFPSLLRIGPDEVWIAYKAGRTHATDAGAAIEVVRHTLSSGETK